jgi:NAD-dependent dihydropyrimidine dehydrogenase PreA subunit
MAYVVTQNCCNDATCVSACLVNCIHPTQDEHDYATAEMLYIDPEVCIDCGAGMDRPLICEAEAVVRPVPGTVDPARPAGSPHEVPPVRMQCSEVVGYDPPSSDISRVQADEVAWHLSRRAGGGSQF